MRVISVLTFLVITEDLPRRRVYSSGRVEELLPLREGKVLSCLSDRIGFSVVDRMPTYVIERSRSEYKGEGCRACLEKSQLVSEK